VGGVGMALFWGVRGGRFSDDGGRRKEMVGQ
jgi:hypothetical protein